MEPTFEFGSYVVSRATPADGLKEIFEFRFKEFEDAGYLAANCYPDRSLADLFDRIATQITVRTRTGDLVGTTRFVPPSPLGFQTELFFGLDAPLSDSRTRIGELGRLAVRKDYRGGDRLIMIAMLKAVFECMLEARVDKIFAFLPPRLADSFAALGCKYLPLVVRDIDEFILRRRLAMIPYFHQQNPIPVVYDLRTMLQEVGVESDAM